MPNLINLACGQTYDSRWINLDQYATTDDVETHDLRTPLPFSDDFAEAIYCSHFLEHLDIVLTREILLQDVWNMDPKVNTRTVDKHVQRLRNKLGSAGEYVQTIRGVGYRLRFPVEKL